MKKVSFVALVAALTASTFAANAQNVPANCPKAFQGFFLGGNVGLGTGNVSHQYNSSFLAVNGTRTQIETSNSRLGVRGFDGGLNTGYNHRFGNWGLGLEFVANWTNVKGSRSHTDNNSVFRHTTRLNNSLQLRGNFSYVIANLVAPKMILGWDSSKWKQQANISEVINGRTQSVQLNRSKYLNAFLVGAGVDFLATKHFIIGMDATVSMFNKNSITRTVPAANTRVTGIQSVTGNASAKPFYTKISLVMKFIY
jgi:opacity protein-like surface antigen